MVPTKAFLDALDRFDIEAVAVHKAAHATACLMQLVPFVSVAINFTAGPLASLRYDRRTWDAATVGEIDAAAMRAAGSNGPTRGFERKGRGADGSRFLRILVRAVIILENG